MTKKLSDKTQEYLQNNYVDICGGIMTLKDLEREIRHYYYIKQPKEMVIHLTERKELGIYSVIYVTKKDFKKKTR